MQLGSIVKSTKDNPPRNLHKGDIGFVYEEYLGTISVIFADGNLEGFTKKEQTFFLETLPGNPTFNYQFKGIYQLTKDFHSGKFNHLFKEYSK